MMFPAPPPFEALPVATYDVVDIDPPWPNENRSPKGEAKSSVAKYGRMSFEQIAALPVGALLKKDALVRLWCTWPLLLHGGDVKRHYLGHDAAVSHPGACLKAWGLRYVTGAAWVKQTASGQVARGTGYRLWSACEPALIAVRGVPKTVAQLNVMFGQRREHSRKPEEGYAWLERLMPNARRLVLFGPPLQRSGWDVWGFAHGVYQPVVHLDGARAAA